ncbi:MAG: 30S ribosomal protein S2 [Candidatus Hydrothermae bacterium]|nr:30S ribosomal protein S2 [Candidatus Hydrothermae bacterium]
MERAREERLHNTQNVNVELPVTVKDLLEAGVHFGHKRRRWNPKMKPFIFTERNKIHIIDLRKTIELLQIAYAKVRDVSSKGGKILFVCTKKQGKDGVKQEAERAGVFYMVERWPGGTLTNFDTIRSRVEYMKDLERMKEDGTLDKYPKKEQMKMLKELEKLEKVFGGIKDMTSLPDLIYIVDIVQEDIALKEAKKLGIPVVAIVDTNADPTVVDYPIPGNDDAIRSINLITKVIADAVIEGRQGKDFMVAEKEFEEKEEKVEEVMEEKKMKEEVEEKEEEKKVETKEQEKEDKEKEEQENQEG